MGAVVTNPRLFIAARELRGYAQRHDLPARTLLRGCSVAKAELANDRTIAVAVCAAQRAMRGGSR